MAIGTTTGPGGTGQITRRERYEQIRSTLLTERGTFDSHWRELGDYLRPRRIRFSTSDRNRGDRRNHNIIDSTPVYAARTLQSGLHAGLTSPARPWMRLTTPDPDLAEHGPIKQWLHTVTRRMLDVFIRSNLYNALPTLYGDMSVFGTGAMGVLEDDPDLLRCYVYPIGSYAVGLDARGIATTFVRDYQFTVRQLVEQFGRTPGRPAREIDWSRFSSQVRTQWDAGNYDVPIEVAWFVSPNDEHDPRQLEARRSMPWHSCYIETGRESDGTFLRESGFRNFPVLVPRWDVTGEDTYGTDCPGMTALGDCKALQIMHRRSAKAVDKALDPPLTGPSIFRTQKTSLLPGDITYGDVREGMAGLRPIHEVRLEGIQHLGQNIRDTQYRIQRAFYEDLFLMLAHSEAVQPATAEEIRAKHEEKLLALGPVLERTNDELLDPLVDRVFSIILEAGGIPEPPRELQGVDLKVEYISVMAQAQKLVGVVGQDRFIQSAITLSQVYPEARHKLNVFAAMNNYADMLGVDPKLNRSDDEARALLEQEQQAAASAQEAEQLKTMAGAAQSLGNTPVTGDSALARLVESQQQPAA